MLFETVMMQDAQAVSLIRDELANLTSASFFVFIGLIAFAVAAIRRRVKVRVLVWIGIWSALFGSNMLVQSPAVRAALPPSLQPALSLWSICASYLIIVAAALAFLELTLGLLRRVLEALLVADFAVAVAGIAAFVISGRTSPFTLLNQLLAVFGLLLLLATVAVPALSRRFLVLSSHRILTMGTFVFAAQALWVNTARPFNVEVPAIYSSLGFAALLLSFAYVALDMMFSNERRLLAIENELQIARQLQFSILPAAAPQVAKLRIAAKYEPMTAVAGDFYDFIAIDENQAGFLVADVSGHGVPAALIASMVKVAAQAVNGCICDPAGVLQGIGAILKNNLRGQFVTASYLWIDTSAGTARYSAAGHPPLLHWRRAEGDIVPVESNGLLFGIGCDTEYPVREIPLVAGDRFLLYTDGLTEPENLAGEQFGDHKLEQVLRVSESLTASELTERLLAELRTWQTPAVAQQDDITLVVIDVI